MKNAIHLIGWGSHPAKPAGEIVVGDVLVWNYGQTSTVIDIKRKAGSSFIDFTTRNLSGAVFSRRMKATRLVAVKMLS